MNACDAVVELLPAHALAALDASEEALVLEHLERCAACQSEREEALMSVALITAPPVTPPPQVWGAIKTRLERTAADDPVRDTGKDPVISLSCSYCRGVMTRSVSVYCASCLAPHHPECFAEYGRCSVMGCGEQQVVRPADLSDLAPITVNHAPAAAAPRALPEREEEPWRRVRPFFLGIAALGLMGGVAAFGPELWNRSQAPVAARDAHDRSRPGVALYQIDVRTATLGEVARELGRSAGVKISVPEGAEHFFVRSALWRSEEWSTALAELGRAHGLSLKQRSAKAWSLEPGPAYEAGPPEPLDWVAEDVTQLMGPSGGRQSDLWTDFAQDVLMAPAGEGVAIRGRRRLHVFHGDTQVGSTRWPVNDAAWSRDGRHLAYLKQTGDESSLLGFFTLGEQPEQRDLRGLPDLGVNPHLVWLDREDSVLVQTARGLCKVSVDGDVLTLAEPVAQGPRFALRSLGPEHVLIEHAGGVEIWRSEGRLRFVRRYDLPPGYRIELTPGSPRALAITPRELLSFRVDGSDARLTQLEARVNEGTWLGALSGDGEHLAWIDGPDACMRDLKGGKLKVLRTGYRSVELDGLTWHGDRIAYWNLRNLWTDEVGTAGQQLILRLPSTSRRAEIRDVRWGAAGLAVTTRQNAARTPTINVRRVD